MGRASTILGVGLAVALLAGCGATGQKVLDTARDVAQGAAAYVAERCAIGELGDANAELLSMDAGDVFIEGQCASRVQDAVAALGLDDELDGSCLRLALTEAGAAAVHHGPAPMDVQARDFVLRAECARAFRAATGGRAEQ